MNYVTAAMPLLPSLLKFVSLSESTLCENVRILDNIFAIRVKFIDGFLDTHQFLIYKIFCFIWTVVGTDMDDDIFRLFLKLRN